MCSRTSRALPAGPALAPYLSGHVPGALTAPSLPRGGWRGAVRGADSGSRWAGRGEKGPGALSTVLMRTPRARAPVGWWASGRLGTGDGRCAVRGADAGTGPGRRGRARGSSPPDRRLPLFLQATARFIFDSGSGGGGGRGRRGQAPPPTGRGKHGPQTPAPARRRGAPPAARGLAPARPGGPASPARPSP